MTPVRSTWWAVALLATALPAMARAQSTPASAEATIDTTADAGEADAIPQKRQMVKWNQYDGPLTTANFGFGFLVDFATYSQDDDSKKQVSMSPDVGLRDFRLLARGRFKTERPFSWTIGYMYDGNDKSGNSARRACRSASPSSRAASSSAARSWATRRRR